MSDVLKSLFVLGSSHHKTPLEIREQFALTPAQADTLQEQLKAEPNIRECLILNTCNRLEIYGLAENEDSFENITLYSNKVESATYKELDDGSFEVSLEVESIKRYFDGNGKLLEEPSNANYLDIAIFGEDGQNELGMTTKTPILIEKQWVKPGKSKFTYVVNDKPVKAGIDPYNKMIDRIPDDNLVSLEEADD